MYFSTLAAAALLSTLGAAQSVNVQAVAVGRNPANNETGTKYWPEKVTAEVGTMVQFQFWAGNHTVTQSSFDNPCIPMVAANSSAVVIDSSYQPVAASEGSGQIPVFTVMVSDAKPIWLYCAQGQHCANGMVMVINENTGANSTRSLDNYKQLAAISGGGSPGGGAGGAGGNGGNGGSPTTGGGTESNVPASAGSSVIAGTSSLLLALGAALMLL